MGRRTRWWTELRTAQGPRLRARLGRARAGRAGSCAACAAWSWPRVSVGPQLTRGLCFFTYHGDEGWACPYCALQAFPLPKSLDTQRSPVGLTAAGYSAIGLTGYLAFPHSAQSNILNNFSRRDGLMQLCRALVGLMKVVSYPINHHPARTCTQDVVAALTGHRPDSAAFNFAHAAGFYLATLAVALAVSDLGQVFKVVGGTNGAFLILGLPGALLMKYASDKALASRIPLVVEQPLLVARGEAPPPRPYRLLTSKLWWAGLGLVGLCVGVLALTIVSIVYPMQPGGE